jgi:hypothetical protein
LFHAVAGAKPVTFAYQTPTLGSTLPLVTAMEFGYFAAEGSRSSRSSSSAARPPPPH